jgi:hypothetical protein
MTLYRLAFPDKLNSKKLTFSRDKSAISRIVKKTVMLLSQEWSHVLQWDHTRLTRAELEQYAQAVADKGGHLCLYDGTVRRVCRPSFGQRSMFSGRKRFYGLNTNY